MTLTYDLQVTRCHLSARVTRHIWKRFESKSVPIADCVPVTHCGFLPNYDAPPQCVSLAVHWVKIQILDEQCWPLLFRDRKDDESKSSRFERNHGREARINICESTLNCRTKTTQCLFVTTSATQWALYLQNDCRTERRTRLNSHSSWNSFGSALTERESEK